MLDLIEREIDFGWSGNILCMEGPIYRELIVNIFKHPIKELIEFIMECFECMMKYFRS
jgi:hypothetical protein